MLDSADGGMSLALESIIVMCLCHSQHCRLWSSCCPYEIYCNLSLSLSLCHTTDELLFRAAAHGSESSLCGHMKLLSQNFNLTCISDSWNTSHCVFPSSWCFPYLQNYMEKHSVIDGEISDALSLVCRISWNSLNNYPPMSEKVFPDKTWIAALSWSHLQGFYRPGWC